MASIDDFDDFDTTTNENASGRYYESADEKPKSSPAYWVALIAIAIAFALGIGFLPTLIDSF